MTPAHILLELCQLLEARHAENLAISQFIPTLEAKSELKDFLESYLAERLIFFNGSIDRVAQDLTIEAMCEAHFYEYHLKNIKKLFIYGPSLDQASFIKLIESVIKDTNEVLENSSLLNYIRPNNPNMHEVRKNPGYYASIFSNFSEFENIECINSLLTEIIIMSSQQNDTSKTFLCSDISNKLKNQHRNLPPPCLSPHNLSILNAVFSHNQFVKPEDLNNLVIACGAAMDIMGGARVIFDFGFFELHTRIISPTKYNDTVNKFQIMQYRQALEKIGITPSKYSNVLHDFKKCSLTPSRRPSG